MLRWYCYNVYAGKKHIDMIKGYSEKHACQKIEKIWGPAKNWAADTEYRAEHVPLGPILGDWKNVQTSS